MPLFPQTRRAQQKQSGYLTPQQAQLLARASSIPSQISGLDQELQGAESRMQSALPRARHTGRGWTVAPHWTEALGSAVTRGLAGQEKRRLLKTREKLAGEQQKAAQVQLEHQEKIRQAATQTAAAQWAASYEQKDRKISADNAMAQARFEEARAARDQAQANFRAVQGRLEENEKAGRQAAFDKRVGRLSSDIEPLMGMVDSFRGLQEAVQPYVSKGKDVPGVGFVMGSQSYTGDMLRAGRDLMFGDNAAQGINTKLRRFLNEVLVAQAGRSQTISETRNVLSGLAAGGAISEDVLIDNMDTIMGALNRDLANVEAGYGSEVVSEYESRFKGNSPLRPLLGLTSDEEPEAPYGHAAGDVPTGAYQTPGGIQYSEEP